MLRQWLAITEGNPHMLHSTACIDIHFSVPCNSYHERICADSIMETIPTHSGNYMGVWRGVLSLLLNDTGAGMLALFSCTHTHTWPPTGT